jgi:hypothetical protein
VCVCVRTSIACSVASSGCMASITWGYSGLQWECGHIGAQWSYNGVAVGLQWGYSGVAVGLLKGYSGSGVTVRGSASSSHNTLPVAIA